MRRSFVAVAVALLMLALAMWTVVPAPTVATLIITLAVTERGLAILPVFAAIGFGMCLFTRGRARIATGVLTSLALMALAWPLIAAWTTWPRVDAELRAAGIAPLRAHSSVWVDVTRDVPVPLRDGTALALDVYRPQLTGTLPLIVTIYPGAWMSGSRRGEEPLARWYAARGYVVAAIDYRHAPGYRFPTQIGDVDDALKTIARLAAGWHADSERVALFGRSSGAQLALLAGEYEQPVRVRALVAYYAPSDLVGGWENPPAPDPAGVRGILEGYLGGPPDAAHAMLYRAAAPLEHAHAGMPPVLAIIGDRDELVRPEFQRNFARRLAALQVRNVAIELPWANHSFDDAGGIGVALAHDATLRFLDAVLRP